MSQAVKAGKLNDFANLHSSKTFISLLRQAVIDPSSKQAIKVFQQVLPILNLSKPISDFGPGARIRSLSKQIACHRRYGPAAAFITIAPNVQEQPTALR